MGKKRVKKDEEEEEEKFGPPPFDQKKYYTTEVEGAKTTLIAVFWALLVAMLCTAIFIVSNHDFAISAVVGVGCVLALKPIMDALKIVTKEFDRMKWLGAGFSYFMTWIAFWVLFVNPPMMDLTPPAIKDSTARKQELGSSIKLVFTASDNAGLSTVVAMVRAPNGAETEYRDLQGESNLYTLDLDNSTLGNYSYTITANDPSGHTRTRDGNFEVVPSAPPVIELIAPSNGSDIAYDIPIVLHITDNAQMAGVYYTLDSDPAHVIVKMERKVYGSYATGIYKVRSNVSGRQWTGGPHTINVFAVDTASNTANTTYTFTLK